MRGMRLVVVLQTARPKRIANQVEDDFAFVKATGLVVIVQFSVLRLARVTFVQRDQFGVFGRIGQQLVHTSHDGVQV